MPSAKRIAASRVSYFVRCQSGSDLPRMREARVQRLLAHYEQQTEAEAVAEDEAAAERGKRALRAEDDDAVATLNRVDVLVTWNCRHLANPHLLRGLRAFMAARELELPEICTPIEMGGDWRMKPDPILEEVWRIKDQLAAEAGYDVDRFFENLRKWVAAHPHPGPVIHNAEELRQYVAAEERKRAEVSAWTLSSTLSTGGELVGEGKLQTTAL